MNELPEKDKRFDFRKYQNAKKSRRMLIRFIIYSIVISFIVYLILEEGEEEGETKKTNSIEQFEIESDYSGN